MEERIDSGEIFGKSEKERKEIGNLSPSKNDKLTRSQSLYIKNIIDIRNNQELYTNKTELLKQKIKKREATEAIKTVIAKYSNSDDYSYFRSQVGAVISSLEFNISQSADKSILDYTTLKL